MTTEEKAKAYDEALKKAQCWLNDPQTIQDCNYTIEDAIQNIFPQLRESEDERIRKKCITIISKWTTKEDRDECIAYLEKQKEQKPIDYPYLPGWRKNHDNNKPELKRSVLMLTTHGVAEGEWLGEKWCQYRWSCELKDGEVLYWIHLSDLERLEKEGEEKQKEPTKEELYAEAGTTENEYIANTMKMVRAMREKQKERKPEEWSEEDEDMLNSCISSIEEAKENRYAYKETDGDTSYDHEIAWLKSLRPQPKQERSEEDKRIIKGIIGKIVHDQTYGVSKDEMLNFLKKL